MMFSKGRTGRTFPVLQPKEFVRPSRLLRSSSHSGYEASSLAFSEFLGMAAMIPCLFSP